MVKIRLRRLGATKRPFYRVVVADSRSPRDGRFIEAIGRYQPMDDPSLVEIDADRALHWLSVGAQPTQQVQHLLKVAGVWAQFEAASPKTAAKQAAAAAAAPPPPTPPPAEEAPAAEADEDPAAEEAPAEAVVEEVPAEASAEEAPAAEAEEPVQAEAAPAEAETEAPAEAGEE